MNLTSEHYEGTSIYTPLDALFLQPYMFRESRCMCLADMADIQSLALNTY